VPERLLCWLHPWRNEERISMYRKSLLAATALVLCVSITVAGPKTGQAGDPNSPRDRKPSLPVRLDHRIPAVLAIGRTGAAPHGSNVSHWVPDAVFNNFSKDGNAEFISWYGFTAIHSEQLRRRASRHVAARQLSRQLS
jgi:hypothetical protein